MDVEVRPVDGCTWEVVDLLGRQVGRVIERDGCHFIVPIGDRLATIDAGPFNSLRAVCDAMASKVRGSCRVVPSEAP